MLESLRSWPCRSKEHTPSIVCQRSFPGPEWGVDPDVLTRRQPWPGDLDALAEQSRLERGQAFRRIPDGAGRFLLFQAIRRERPGRLADGPLDGVQPIAAVGDVGRAQVLAGRQQVLDPARDQGTEWDEERERADVDVVVAAGAGVQVD